LVASTGTTPYGQTTIFANGIKVFVGQRHDPFFIDLPALFRIIPDRDFKNPQKDPSPQTVPKFGSFNFPSSATPVKDVTGASYGTAGTLGCNIQTPGNTLAPFDVESFVISVPKALLLPSGQAPGKIGVWSTSSTPTGT